ncbi:uncharacterized protein LOC110033425 isoform X1 [Phalaenopsis equestris]|uniref:uncharacterized protein LOC110033425 isoform X1 n=1 Tax=Phalaenopsis equestris TaxID=78828 RepID=UPI0009E1F582|nr:uncharacterized protein LOC110033425 isoform X1 [Phalaenopsis equestris]
MVDETAWMTQAFEGISNFLLQWCRSLDDLCFHKCCYQWLVTCEQLICHWGEGEMGLHLKMAQRECEMKLRWGVYIHGTQFLCIYVQLGRTLAFEGYCFHESLLENWLVDILFGGAKANVSLLLSISFTLFHIC